VSVSVVIATRDRADFLAQALTSLDAQRDPPPFEVVVVDNGSRDGTAALVAERAARAPFPLRYAFVEEPNRGKARNAGVALATGEIVAFVDDDVWLPEGFLAAHARAHARGGPLAVSGPIINVPGYDARPSPGWRNYSGAYFCTCNVSTSRAAFDAVGGFDERFRLYGWEDTELGLRLRRSGVRRAFAWGAFLWHIKPAHVETLDVVLAKTRERAQMAARLLDLDDGWRTKLATGAYGLNLARASLLAPGWSLAAWRRAADDARLPAFARAYARGALLDGTYTTELRRALAARRA
jgi:GT2 family glycosyltransferase